jgi:uncharacterized phage-like protein YoqJ
VIVSFSGHRPPKGGLSWSADQGGDHLAVARVRGLLVELTPEWAIVGGALGFDMLAARACWLEDVRFAVFVPFVGQESRWPAASQSRYYEMLRCARWVEVVSDSASKSAFQIRNQAMVDESDLVVAWWDGSAGGTANCVGYANRVGRPVVNLLEA